MTKRKPKIIQDKKLRGEWAESVFMARAGEHGLPVSRPWGEMSSYDFIIGKTGRFVSVQVKSTIFQEGTGYGCTVRGGHKAYPAGAFDFVAAYVVPEDVWYIIPAKVIRGKRSITLYPQQPTALYEKYREAWHLLREAAESAEVAQARVAHARVAHAGEAQSAEIIGPEAGAQKSPEAAAPARRFPRNAAERMEAVANFVRRQMQGSNVDPQNRNEDIDT